MGGSTEDLRRRDLTQTPEKYNYVSQGGITRVDSINDKGDFKNVNLALKSLGLNESDVRTMWDVVASILHLGNVAFKSSESGDATSVSDVTSGSIESCAK